MFNPRSFDNSRSGGIGVLEIMEGPGKPGLFVPLKRTELSGEVAGPLASLRLRQVFGYSREACDKVLEAIYRFPLPGDAAVTGVRVRFGDVEIVAELKAREKAEKEYEEAKAQGKQAALATRESADVFTLQVSGIRPDEDVLVETSVVQLAKPEGVGWRLRIPLTTAPRYLRSDEAGSRHVHGQPLFTMRDPGHRFAMDLRIREVESASSPTHRLDVAREEGGIRLKLAEGEVVPDRDCVIVWQPVQDPLRPLLKVICHEDADSDTIYFLALLSPPSQLNPETVPSREAVLLIDHSGSMSGPKWEASDWAAKQFLSTLTEKDAFDLATFHNDTAWFAPAPLSGDQDAVQKAVEFLESHKDSGGTEMGLALEQALSLKRTPGEWARHILILTDAEVTDDGRILRLAEDETSRPDRRRINVICVDASPNALLVHELAEKGGGVARFLTSSPEEDDITTALDEVLLDWVQPAYTGLRLEVHRSEVLASGREGTRSSSAGWSAVDLGDLPGGRACWVVARAPRSGSSALAFRLVRGEADILAEWETQQAGCQPGVKALFGARRILSLEFLIHSYSDAVRLRDRLQRLGYDPDEVLSAKGTAPQRVYAENARKDAEAALRGLLLKESLDFGLASSETGFVAVRSQAGKPIQGTVAVANALPTGWSSDFAVAAPPNVGLTFPMMPAPGLGSGLSNIGAGLGGALGLRGLMGNIMSKMTSGDPAPTQSPPDDTCDGFGRSHGTAPSQPPVSAAKPIPIFFGIPQFEAGSAVLFDSSGKEDADRLPSNATFTRIFVRLTGEEPPALGPEVQVWIYMDDLSVPRARVVLADILKQAGSRPINLRYSHGQIMRIVMVDPKGSWSSGLAVVMALGMVKS